MPERNGMSGSFFCQGCGASGDLAKYKRIRKVVLANPAFETSMLSGVNSQNQFVKARENVQDTGIIKRSCINL